MTADYGQFEQRLRGLMVPTAASSPEEWENHWRRRADRQQVLLSAILRTLQAGGHALLLMGYGLLPLVWTLFDVSEDAILGIHAGQLTIFAVWLSVVVEARFRAFAVDPPHATLPVDDKAHWQASHRFAWLVAVGILPVIAVVYFETVPGWHPRVDPLMLFFWAILQTGATLLTCFLLTGRRSFYVRNAIPLVALLLLFPAMLLLLLSMAPQLAARPGAPLLKMQAWTIEHVHLVNYLTPCGWVNQAFLAVQLQGDATGWLWLVLVAVLGLVQIERLSTHLEPLEIELGPRQHRHILLEEDLEFMRSRQAASKSVVGAEDSASQARTKSDAELEAVIRSSLLPPIKHHPRSDAITRVMNRALTAREKLLIAVHQEPLPLWGTG